MNEQHKKALSIFSPHYLDKVNELESKNLNLVQYTSADAATKMIKNKEVWLRNSQCMNDYSEIKYGERCLMEAFRDGSPEKAAKEKFKQILDIIFPNITESFLQIFNSWIPSFHRSTYIACVSEHPEEEDEYGRLSMWRAYGGNNSVALVMNKKPFLSETDVFHAYSQPVDYIDIKDFDMKFDGLFSRISSNIDFIKSLGEQAITGYLFEYFKYVVTSTKHPGFREEREWRVIYSPENKESDHITSSTEVIDGVPQEVYKIPLKDIPEENFYGASVPEFIEKIIIGPSNQQNVMRSTFVKLLKDAGCENPENKVCISGIPLRR